MTNMGAIGVNELSTLSSPVRHLLLDLDGTSYVGGVVIDGVPESLDAWVEAGNSVTFLTNNTSKTLLQHAERLSELGLPATLENVITPVELTARRLVELGFDTAYFLATDAVVTEFGGRGVRSSEADPKAVVVGYDKELTYQKLDKASALINGGIPYFATHPDYFCPTEYGPVPDCGSFVEMIQGVTGVAPVEVFGKPSKSLVDFLRKEHPEGAMIIGDRLHTDILTGVQAGVPSCLVLTGETTMGLAATSDVKPTLIYDSLPRLIADLLGT